MTAHEHGHFGITVPPTAMAIEEGFDINSVCFRETGTRNIIDCELLKLKTSVRIDRLYGV